jgi:hypothetical protein
LGTKRENIGNIFGSDAEDILKHTRISTDIKAETFKNERRTVNKNVFTNDIRRAKSA